MLVSVNVTNHLGPSIQLLAILSVFAVFFRYLEISRSLFGWLLLIYVSGLVALGVFEYGTQQSVLRGGKLTLFCLASLLSVRGSSGDGSFAALVALRAFLGLCGLNFLYAFATGQSVFRFDHFIEFSIYSGYTIAILVYLARPRLTLLDRALAVVANLLCGSTMALLLLLLAELVGRRWRPRFIVAMLVMAPVGFLALNFLMEIRGKEFSWDYLANSDRAMLLKGYWQMVRPEVSLHEWFFGVGVGQPLHGFLTADEGFNGYLLRLGEGGVYAFSLHNETLRILCDFGIVGLILVGLRLWVNCSYPLLILLAICMLTNSYLYSFSGALLASSLFKPGSSLAARADREFQPALAHA